MSRKIDSEDIIVLGFLSAFTLWTYVVLPLHYSWSGSSHHSSAMSSMNWVIPVVSFLGGSMATHLVKSAFDYVMRPVISARLVDHRGCYVTTSRGNPPTHNARFLRLLIENSGRSSIRNCSGYVTSITRIENGIPLPVQQEVLELN
jgi:hypothetical protein